jgi:hypothetical protein
MKFSEIPQLISGGSYEPNYSLSSIPRVLEEWKEESGLILNPDFQRGHVWTQQQQTNFMEYILRGGRSGLVIYFNQPSWQRGEIIDGYDDFVCVDGLQRLTTVVQFLNNEVPVFGQLYREFGEDIRRSPANMTGFRLNVNSLKTREQVLTWYLQMNDGGTPHTVEEIKRVKGLLQAEREKPAPKGEIESTFPVLPAQAKETGRRRSKK